MLPEMNRVPTASKKENSMNWNGWGFKDSRFSITPQGDLTFSGDRYAISGGTLPNFRQWFEEELGVKLIPVELSNRLPSALNAVPMPTIARPLIEWLKLVDMAFTTDAVYRLNRSHGQLVSDMVNLREATIGRVPDIVVWPDNHQQVLELIRRCQDTDIVVIPVGGCTNVTRALECPADETRCIVSLDTTEMNKILWVDKDSMLCRVEAGIVGINLEEHLNKKGFTIGHEPDSIEVSTLGGWVATRASGIKQNKYGNIEDLVVHVTMVSPTGVVQKSCMAPRTSLGPDIHHFIIGSEGIFGVVTEVTIKIFHMPECRRYNSILFENFDRRLTFMREVANQRCAPASIRMVDNGQFRTGYAMRLAPLNYFGVIKDIVQRMYVTKWQGFDLYQVSAVTLFFEGTTKEVTQQEARICELGKKFGGLVCGETHGLNGYRLTFAVAYIRDFIMDYAVMGESLETSVSWDRVAHLCSEVKKQFLRECDKLGIPPGKRVASCKVTQVYDAGCCAYFYFVFNASGLSNPVEKLEEMEKVVRTTMLRCGGSISHHHGVGKKRAPYLQPTIGELGLGLVRSIKQELDPKNIFASNNLFACSKQ